jgi:hypothetical protein
MHLALNKLAYGRKTLTVHGGRLFSSVFRRHAADNHWSIVGLGSILQLIFWLTNQLG